MIGPVPSYRRTGSADSTALPSLAAAAEVPVVADADVAPPGRDALDRLFLGDA